MFPRSFLGLGGIDTLCFLRSLFIYLVVVSTRVIAIIRGVIDIESYYNNLLNLYSQVLY